MELIELRQLFDVEYGNSFELNQLDETDLDDSTGINFVSRTRENNGVSAIVRPRQDTKPFEAGLITVAGSGNSVLESFVQPKPFYTGFHVFILKDKGKLTEIQKLFYCYCIKQNQYKYSFGRQANRTLRNLLVPAKMLKQFENALSKMAISNIASNPEFKKPMREGKISLQDRTLKCFKLSDLFEIRKGKRIVVSKETTRGNCPFVSATDKNNGISEKLDLTPNQDGNTITVSYDGSVGEAFYQAKQFWAADSVNVLYPKFNLNPFIAMFLITMIRKEKYRFSYGRKWHKERMEESTIKLPVDKNANPDWQFMEAYIKSLPYSSNL